jgi:hypothetical protein
LKLFEINLIKFVMVLSEQARDHRKKIVRWALDARARTPATPARFM